VRDETSYTTTWGIYSPDGSLHVLIYHQGSFGQDCSFNNNYYLDVIPSQIISAKYRILAVADDHSYEPLPYTMSIYLNDVLIGNGVALTNVPHAVSPPGVFGRFTNFTIWEYSIPTAYLHNFRQGNNKITLVLYANRAGNWIALEWSEIEVSIMY